MRILRINVVICFCLFQIGQLAAAQQPAQLENLLNKVDTTSSWSNVPASGMPPGQQPLQYVQPSNPAFNQPQNFIQPNNPLSGRQQILRTLFGASPQTNSSSDNKWGSSNAYSDWQEAENQASRAYNAEERARYEKDKGNRDSDASEAYYAANAARNASDRVYYASQKGDPTAQQYADKARAAADRARADSDKARYYADTGN